MRTIKESPVFRVVRRTSPYTSARERWKERMERSSIVTPITRTQTERRRIAVETVREDTRGRQQHDRDEVIADDDEREPTCEEGAPLRYSSEEMGEDQGCSSSAGSYRPAQSLLKNSPAAQTHDCTSLLESSFEKITLLGLLASSSGSSGCTPDAPQRSALQIQSSGDVNTIDGRFQTLSVARQRQRLAQVHRVEKTVATRRRILMKTLGMQQYYKALSLVKEVKRLRQRVLSPFQTSSSKKIKISKAFLVRLPEAGRNLLLNTSLVSALEQTETEQLGKLPWGDLILQAHQNVSAYYEWQSMTETRE